MIYVRQSQIHKRVVSIVLFKAEKVDLKNDELPPEFAFRYWRPGIFNWKPKGKPLKYYLYTVFHFTGIFKNKSYAYLELMDLDTGIPAASLLIVPAHFKYPFMKKNDIQFTYVMTKQEYRGKRLAILLLEEAWGQRKDKSGMAWYVTNTDNTASIRVAEKAGFALEGYGKRERGMLNRLLKTDS